MNMHYDLAKAEIASRLHHAEPVARPRTRGPSCGRVSRRGGSDSDLPDTSPRLRGIGVAERRERGSATSRAHVGRPSQ